MRQVLLTNDGVTVARMPRPALCRGTVLVRVRYSMISIGTEIAGLRPSQDAQFTKIQKAKEYTGLAGRYLSVAFNNPRHAAKRVLNLAHNYVERISPPKQLPDQAVRDVQWHKDNAQEFSVSGDGVHLLTDESEWQYQAHTNLLTVPEGYDLAVDLKGEIGEGRIAIGILDQGSSRWLSNKTIHAGSIDDRIILNPQGESRVQLVISNAQGGATLAKLDHLHIVMVAPNPDGLPHTEMDATGWNLGYSVAGEVVAVGEGVFDLSPGDLVACGGAGKANHSDYAVVPRNLVCRVPNGCDLQAAATTTIGTIAMQGVRRASPTLGEKVCVIGLGLLGQLTAQILRANGCFVIGMDIDPKRVERAKSQGMEQGAADNDQFKQLVRDHTRGLGADRTLITAATKSNKVINLAMEITRRRGTVVIVGDVGLDIERANFYKKEIDLLMSTSYGPGRYDRLYEEEGIDYPFAFVRWTQNRNMESYMDLIANGSLNVNTLIDLIAPVNEASHLYNTLASGGDAPLGVLLEYGDEELADQPSNATRIALRGHRKAQNSPINYVLVGAGAYGQSMLVPIFDKHRESFFLRGVVSRDSVRGGNLVRERRLEIFSSELQDVLVDPDVHMLVVATRHIDHAKQVLAGIRAGKHVFVEKPLAINWSELDEIVRTYESMDTPPLLMVGFNRRFSPAFQILRKLLAERSSPLIINYRLNGGYIPTDSWIQNEQGGGRNVGEACHMYDVFRSLAKAQVESVQATSINPGALPYLRTDNFVATITYADGSVGNLVYTALGPKKGMPKERIEVFCDGEAYIVDDFKRLIRASKNEVLWSSEEFDKGQATEIKMIEDALVNGGPPPIPFDEIAETTAVSLFIEDILNGRITKDA